MNSVYARSEKGSRYVLISTCGLAFLFGACLGEISLITEPIILRFSLNDVQTGFLLGCSMLGAMCSTVVVGLAKNLYPHLSMLFKSDYHLCSMIAALGMAFGFGFCLLDVNIWYLYTGRFLQGVGSGIHMSVSALWIRKTFNELWQERLIAVLEICLCIGCLTSSIWAYVETVVWSNSWQLASALPFSGAVVVNFVLLFYTLMFLPTRIRTPKYDVSPSPHTEIVSTAVRRNTFALGMSAAILHGLSGGVVFQSYARWLFSLAGISKSIGADIGIVACKLLGAVVTLLLLPSFGKRKLLLVGILGMVCTLSLIAGTTHKHIILSSMLLFQISWSISWAPLMLLVCSEWASSALAMGFMMSTYWACTALSSISLPWLAVKFGFHPVVGFFAISNVVGVIFTLQFVPKQRQYAMIGTLSQAPFGDMRIPSVDGIIVSSENHPVNKET